VLQVEIEVIGEGGTIELEETGLEEVVDAAKNAQAASDDSALALLADITSKYQQGEPLHQVLKKEEIEEVHRRGCSIGLLIGKLCVHSESSRYERRHPLFALDRRWCTRRKR